MGREECCGGVYRFYNHGRLHQRLGMLAPVQEEEHILYKVFCYFSPVIRI